MNFFTPSGAAPEARSFGPLPDGQYTFEVTRSESYDAGGGSWMALKVVNECPEMGRTVLYKYNQHSDNDIAAMIGTEYLDAICYICRLRPKVVEDFVGCEFVATLTKGKPYTSQSGEVKRSYRVHPKVVVGGIAVGPRTKAAAAAAAPVRTLPSVVVKAQRTGVPQKIDTAQSIKDARTQDDDIPF
jgi:hypothetical protein